MDFYYMEISAPCRAVMLTAKAVNVKLNKKVLNLLEKEQLKPEFVAINPQHVVPTLVDGDFAIWESRAICSYLANKHGREDLYPKDALSRAKVDRLLFFDMGTLYDRFGKYVYPVIFGNEKKDPEQLKKVHEALGWLNQFLEGNNFAIGPNITIADHVLAASVSTFVECGVCLNDHPNVKAWLSRCEKQMAGYDTENGQGAKSFGKFAKSKLN